jgi:NAD(P)-dependent dehydrogenase (short-subunit alcohol dehydrogenase family)
MNKKVFITGVSGLLGRALADVFCRNGFWVVGQYHRHKPAERENCQWVRADFSSLSKIRSFLQENRASLGDCPLLVNNYGPITYKDTAQLTAEDFVADFHRNVITAVEITGFFIRHAPLRGVVNLGFEFAGEIKAYRKILAYAAAKNALRLITASWAEAFPGICFTMVGPGTLTGAAISRRDGGTVDPERVAGRVFDILTGPAEKEKGPCFLPC